MEIKCKENYSEVVNLKKEIAKRDNIIKLLTSVIDVIKNDVSVKTQQLDYLIEHMKNHNYDEFDYKTCINSLDKFVPLKQNLKNAGFPNTINDKNKNIINSFDSNNDSSNISNPKEHNKLLSWGDKMRNRKKFLKTFNNNIIMEIFKYLSAKDLTFTSLVSKKLNELSNSKNLWNQLYIKKYNSFLFFDEKGICKVINNVESMLMQENTIQRLVGKPVEFLIKNKYVEYRRLERQWEEERPSVTTIQMSGCVTSVNLNLKNNELIATSVDGSAALYRLYSLKDNNKDLCMQHHKQTKACDRINTFHGHGGPIWCADFHEELLYTGSYDKTLKIWNLKYGNCLSTIRAHSSWVSALQYDPKFQTLISSSWDATIKLWNPHSSVNLLTLTDQLDNSIYCVKSNLENQEIIAGTQLKMIDLWNTEKKVKSLVLQGHQDRINSIKIFENSIFSSSEDKFVKVWDKRSGDCEINIIGHTKGVTLVDYDHVNNRVYSCSLDKTIKIWDIRKNKEIRTLIGHSSGVYSITYDQAKIISGSNDNTIRIWNFYN